MCNRAINVSHQWAGDSKLLCVWKWPSECVWKWPPLPMDINGPTVFLQRGWVPRKESTKIMLRLWLNLFWPFIIFIPDRGYSFRIWGQCRIESIEWTMVNLSHPDKFLHTIAAPKVTNLHLAMDKRELLASLCQSKTFPFPKLAGDRTWSWIRTWPLIHWFWLAGTYMYRQNKCSSNIIQRSKLHDS